MHRCIKRDASRRERAREKRFAPALSRFAFCIITVNWCNVGYTTDRVMSLNRNLLLDNERVFSYARFL